MSVIHHPNVVNDGLIACWDAANRVSYPGAGTTWTDVVGGNEGILQNRGGAGGTAPSFVSEWQGVIDFDGTDDEVDCGTNQIIPLGTSPVTMSYWIRNESLPDRYVSMRFIQSDDTELIIGWYKNGEHSAFYFGFRFDSSIRVANDTGYDIDDWLNQWVNITLVYLGGTKGSVSNWALYFNSKPLSIVLGGTIGGSVSTIRNVFSNNDNSTGGHLNGYMASMSVWNRALSVAEIKQNYDAMKYRFNL